MGEERRREKPVNSLPRPSSRRGEAQFLPVGCKNDETDSYLDSYPEKVMLPYLSLAVAETGGDVVPAPLGLLTLAYSLSRGSSSGMAAELLP